MHAHTPPSKTNCTPGRGAHRLAGGEAPRRQPLGRVATAIVLAFLVAPACLYDAEDRCGENQELRESVVCVCVANAVQDPNGHCVLCAVNEVAAGAECVCAPGYTRSLETEVCEPMPADLGAECLSVGACVNPDFPYCHFGSEQDGETPGYCTSADCESSEDCEGGYACVDGEGFRFCERPPIGMGVPCQTADDCATFEATFCDTYTSHVCLVQGCDVSDDDCFPGLACCDLASLGLGTTLCLPEGQCPTH